MSELKLLKDLSKCLCAIRDSLSAPKTRRDVELLCDVTDPENPVPVIVRYEYQTDGSSEVLAALNLDLTPYTGAITALRACGADQERYDIEEKDFCVNGQSVIRVRVYDAESISTSPVAEGWTDLFGATITTPVGTDTVLLGACKNEVLYPYQYEACAIVTATNSEIEVRVFELRNASGVVINQRLEDSLGVDVTASVTLSQCSSCCDETEHCILANLFDTDSGLFTPGDTSEFQLLIDGVVTTTVIHDYSTSVSGTSKASWYTPIVAAVNALPGWNMILVSDIVLPANGKPQYQITYTGSTPQTLRIQKDSGGIDWTEYVADGAGAMTGNWSWSPDSTPFNACV